MEDRLSLREGFYLLAQQTMTENFARLTRQPESSYGRPHYRLQAMPHQLSTEIKGRQYVVIGAGGGKSGAPSGGTYVAFALPEE